jgi:hypothetical protein
MRLAYTDSIVAGPAVLGIGLQIHTYIIAASQKRGTLRELLSATAALLARIIISPAI